MGQIEAHTQTLTGAPPKRRPCFTYLDGFFSGQMRPVWSPSGLTQCPIWGMVVLSVFPECFHSGFLQCTCATSEPAKQKIDVIRCRFCLWARCYICGESHRLHARLHLRCPKDVLVIFSLVRLHCSFYI